MSEDTKKPMAYGFSPILVVVIAAPILILADAVYIDVCNNNSARHDSESLTRRMGKPIRPAILSWKKAIKGHSARY